MIYRLINLVTTVADIFRDAIALRTALVRKHRFIGQ